MSDQLTFSLEEPHASHSASPDSERDWMMTVATWPSNFAALLLESAPVGSSGKMSLESFPLPGQDMVEVPSDISLKPLLKSGMASPGESLMLNTSEHVDFHTPSPNEDVVCSLSDILETESMNGDRLARYSLSAKACAGILRRAEKRGKKLPEQLARALQQVVDLEPILKSAEG